MSVHGLSLWRNRFLAVRKGMRAAPLSRCTVTGVTAVVSVPRVLGVPTAPPAAASVGARLGMGEDIVRSACACACMHVWVCLHVCVYMYACSCAGACVRAWSGPRVSECMRVCARALVRVVCMRMRILAQMRMRVCVCASKLIAEIKGCCSWVVRFDFAGQIFGRP